jgi:hypothetical protein
MLVGGGGDETIVPPLGNLTGINFLQPTFVWLLRKSIARDYVVNPAPWSCAEPVDKVLQDDSNVLQSPSVCIGYHPL